MQQNQQGADDPQREADNEMIAVTIVEDDVELKEMWADHINSQRGFICVSSYTTCEEAVQNIKKDKPNVVLMDITLAGELNGVDGVRLIRALRPETEIIMATINHDDEMIFEALVAGATGYLVKIISPERLLNAIREVINGGAPMSPDIGRKIVEILREYGGMSELSERERQVLDLICIGKSQKQIADILDITIDTVKFHTKNIYKKLHVANAAEAAYKAGMVQGVLKKIKALKLLSRGE